MPDQHSVVCRGARHLRLVPAPPPPTRRQVLDELRHVLGELQANNAEMRAVNERMLERLRGGSS